MADPALKGQLRAGNDKEVRACLRNALQQYADDINTLTTQLLEAVDAGSVPQSIFRTYITLTNDPSVPLAALQQSRSAVVRFGAVKKLAKLLRSKANFHRTWTTFGGALGISALMRQLSVAEVKLLCQRLSRVAALVTEPGSIYEELEKEKREKMSELLQLLLHGNPRDTRNLRTAYLLLVKTCTPEVRAEWYKQRNGWGPEEDIFFANHPDVYWEPLLPPDTNVVDFFTLEPFMSLNRKKFSMDALKRILDADPAGLEINPRRVVDVLLIPFIKHLHRRKKHGDLRAQVWSMVLECFKKYPKFVQHLDIQILSLAARWWNRPRRTESRQRATNIFTSLLELTPRANCVELGRFIGILYSVAPSRRYELLCLLLRCQSKYGVDIESPTDADKTKLKNLQDKLSTDLLMMIPPEKALELLDLLDESRPGHNYILPSSSSSSILAQTANAGGHREADLQLLRCFLMSLVRERSGQENPDSSTDQESIMTIIKERMLKSKESREPSLRLFWAKSAIFLSIASRSLRLYSDTLLWARRFDKDPQTIEWLYNNNALQTKEGLDLLCGIPARASTHLQPSTVARNVEAGNEILLKLFEAASAMLAEPGTPRCSAIGAIPSVVVRRRLKYVNTFQSHMNLTDDAIYDLIWKPTIEMLIKAESFALQEGHERLGWGESSGMLRGFPTNMVKDLRDHSWRFFDDLCKARDELWHRIRVQRHPAVLTLPPPWPKGLPVQFLCPEILEDGYHKLPYIVSRATDVVFADSKDLLSSAPWDRETKDAIQGFVDDYQTCVRIYANGGPSGSFDSRIRRAWDYAVGELSSGRMSSEEAKRTWKQWCFNKHGKCHVKEEVTKPPVEAKPKDAPTLPEADNPTQPVEWNPDPGAKTDASSERPKGRALNRVCLDAMLGSSVGSRHCSGSLFTTTFSIQQQVTVPPPGNSRPQFWDRGSSYGSTKEALVAAAILLTNNRQGADSSLLMQPFPSAEDLRFPAMYLADEFLEAEKSKWVLRVLGQHQDRVPVDLLSRLARSVYKQVKQNPKPENRRDALEVIQFISQGDSPAVACSLIRDVIMDDADNSSWYRQFFNSGFLSRLSAKESKLFLEGMSKAIIGRLQMFQGTPKDAQESEPANPTARAPVVKITTVKMLAQVFRDTRFIDIDTALTILGDIFRNAKHIDIRTAVTASLADIFDNSTDDKVKDSIIRTLQTNIVPIAASLSERWPTSEQDWADAEESGKMPKLVGMEEPSTERPMLEILLSNYTLRCSDSEWKKTWADEVVVGIIDKSIENNKRWMELFLKKHGFSLADAGMERLPVPPIDPRLLERFIRDWGEHMPDRLLKLFRDYAILTRSSLPPIVAAVNKTVEKDPKLASSVEGSHWLAVWKRRDSVFGLNAVTSLLDKILSEATPRSPEDNIIKSIQAFLNDVAEVLIIKSDKDELQSLARSLAFFSSGKTFSYTSTGKDRYNNWKRYNRPVLQNIIHRIESLRTDAWQRDRHRRPRSLPDTFWYRIQLLPVPIHGTRVEDQEPAPYEEIKEFLGEVKGLIAKLVVESDGRGGFWLPTRSNWEALRDFVVRQACKADYLRIANELAGSVEVGSCRRGALKDNSVPTPVLSMADFQCIELADSLIRRADGADPTHNLDDIARVGDMLTRWKYSPVEMVRERGKKTERYIKDRVKKGQKEMQHWIKYQEHCLRVQEERKKKAKKEAGKEKLDDSEEGVLAEQGTTPSSVPGVQSTGVDDSDEDDGSDDEGGGLFCV